MMEKEFPLNNIFPIPALKDNYIWTLLDKNSKKAYVVDPGDAAPVINTLNSLGFSLAGILITHHHADHSAGILELINFAGNIPVIASCYSPLQQVNKKVKEGDDILFGNFQLKAMEIPGHTLDHMAYYTDADILFSGDTLFSAGCGRIFEGTPEMMFGSLNKLIKLNDETKLYCGHEYTLANLNFAKEVEPHNPFILNKINLAKKIKMDNGCTLPSTLADEKKINPFLRFAIPDVIQAAEKHAGKQLTTPLEVFTTLRTWKNQWK